MLLLLRFVIEIIATLNVIIIGFEINIDLFYRYSCSHRQMISRRGAHRD